MLFLGAYANVWALDDLDDESASERVRELAESILADRFPDFASRLSVRVVRIGGRLDAEAGLTMRLPVLEGVPRGHTQVRLLRSTREGAVESGSALLYVSHFDSVVVAHRDMRSGEAVTERDVGTAWIDVTTFRGQPAGRSLIAHLGAGEPMYTTQPIASGDALRVGDLRPPHAAETGDPVTLRYRRGSIVLTLPCRAREPGAAGEVIRLYSDATKTTYRARLEGDGTAVWVATR